MGFNDEVFQKFGMPTGPDPSEASFTTLGGQNAVEHFAKVIAAVDPTQDDLDKAGNYFLNKTRSNALSGFDVNSRPFAPYSPLYAKAKGQTNVDLYGRRSQRHMLDAVETRISVQPPVVEAGIFNDPELALRGRVHNEGLWLFGGKATAFISNLKHRSRQKIAGLKRQFGNKGGIKVIPKRRWLEVTRQDLKIMSELIIRSALERMKGVQ